MAVARTFKDGTKDQHSWQLFGAFSPRTANSYVVVASTPPQAPGWSAHSRCAGPRAPGSPPTERTPEVAVLTEIQTSGFETLRADEDPLGPITDAGLIIGRQVPAGFVKGGLTRFKVSVNVATTAGPKRWLMDVGQMWTGHIRGYDIEILGPPGVQLIQPNVVADTIANSIVSDAIVTCAAAEVDTTSDNNRRVKFSQTISAAASATGATIQVPAFAERLSIFQSPGPGGSSVQWLRLLGDAAVLGAGGEVSIGTISFRGTREVLNVAVGDESHLQMDADAANARQFLLVWTLRP